MSSVATNSSNSSDGYTSCGVRARNAGGVPSSRFSSVSCNPDATNAGEYVGVGVNKGTAGRALFGADAGFLSEVAGFLERCPSMETVGKAIAVLA